MIFSCTKKIRYHYINISWYYIMPVCIKKFKLHLACWSVNWSKRHQDMVDLKRLVCFQFCPTCAECWWRLLVWLSSPKSRQLFIAVLNSVNCLQIVQYTGHAAAAWLVHAFVSVPSLPPSLPEVKHHFRCLTQHSAADKKNTLSQSPPACYSSERG